LTASAINLAASDSPSYLIILAFLSSSFFCTTNFYLSASYYATYFDSIAYANSFPKAKCVKATSSKAMLNPPALLVISSLIELEIFSLKAYNCKASYLATSAFKTSLTIDGKILSS